MTSPLDPTDPTDPTAPPLDSTHAASVAMVFRAAAEATRNDPRLRGATIHLEGAGSIWVTGDLHDHELNFQRIVKLADLDTLSNSENHANQLLMQEVIHGPNQINGMDMSVRMLANCADLKRRYPSRVTMLQSNHELAQLNDEYITKEGVNVVAAFATGLDFLYGDDADDVRSAMQDYLRSLPLAARTPGGVLMTHSLPAPKCIEHFDKGVLDRELTDEDLAPHGSAYELVWGRYHNGKITQELAEAWGVNVMLVGHQPAEAGYDPVAHNTLILAADHSRGQALPVNLNTSYTRDQLIDLLVPLASVTAM
ncbi:MAG: hypothetical protein V3V20_11560 [Algisphaera sp.]